MAPPEDTSADKDGPLCATVTHSQALLRGMLAASPDCVKILSVDGQLEFMNERGVELNQLPSVQVVLGQEFAALWPEEEREKIRGAIRRAAAGEMARVEGFCPTAKGEPRWWEASFASFRMEGGGPLKLVGISRDITTRVRSQIDAEMRTARLQAALALVQESQARLSLALGVARLGMFDWDTVTGDVDMDARSRDIFGLSPAGTINQRDVFNRIAPEELQRVFAAAQASSEQGERVEISYTIVLPDGTRRSILSSGEAVDDLSGKRRLVGVFNDTTALKRAEDDLIQANQTLEQRVDERTAELMLAEEALRQAQKMEAIGQLTGGVAHDFNNLLTVIKSSTDLLKRPNLSEERRSRYVAAISDTVDRAAKLTGQLLAFARRQALKPEVFAACDSVRALSGMVGTLTGSRIAVTTDLPEHPSYVEVDPSQFDTALVNLAVNARDAMDGEGRITIAVRTVDAIPAVRSHPDRHGAYVAVSLSDTGSGIPADRIERIFEPFFTTKGVGKGTGLGLSQVFGFAKQSGGDVAVDSAVGEGTTFTLYLPRVAAPAPAATAEAPEALADGHGTRVLVVEDNADVGTFAVQTLTDLGYAPVLAADGPAALAELAKDPARFDVVFSDVMMPGMDGVELGQEIRRLYRDLPVVLTSGYSHVLAQNGTHGFELLHKPYSVEQLSQMLRKAAAWRRRWLLEERAP